MSGGRCMYTEILKMLEGGLAGDKEKLINYASVLADNLEKQGEGSFARRIRAVLNKKNVSFTSLDSLSTRPVDSESRMEIVEISTPHVEESQIILGKYAQNAIFTFVDGYENRDTLLRSGIDVANSLLLYGPPGCGKTTVAQFISSITGLPLVTARLDGLVSSLLGSTAKNIRKIFDFASKRECILFLDEFDVIAKLRDDKNELGELKRVVNSLIQNIDSFSSDSILIAATNHHELLDPAIWRRFSTVISLEKPQREDIGKLLHILLKEKSNNFMNNPKKLVFVEGALVGLSHSDIKTIVFSAIRNMILSGREELTNCDVLKEIYFHKNHGIDEENEFITFLLFNGVTHKEMNDCLKIPLRKIQGVSKKTDRKE